MKNKATFEKTVFAIALILLALSVVCLALSIANVMKETMMTLTFLFLGAHNLVAGIREIKNKNKTAILSFVCAALMFILVLLRIFG